ncbi:MAG: B12-binding domain-containing radical SAM protein [Candidatus Aminicenantes bacterium]
MNYKNGTQRSLTYFSQNKVLLGNLPFWSPLVPAQGIASLKGFLQQHGYKVKTVDWAANNELLEYYKQYFLAIGKFIPEKKRGNFYNIGHDVLRNHMMIHINYQDVEEYIELAKILIYNTYYWNVDTQQVFELKQILDRLFGKLKENFLALLEEEKPGSLGLSVNSGNLPTSKFIFELTRTHYPQVKTIMGGCVFFNHLAIGNPDLEFFLEKTKDYIDKIIIGKGEILLLKLLRGELPGSQRLFTQEDVSPEDLEVYRIDIPDLSDYNLDHYFYLAASGSSSCPFKCSFCNARTFFGKFKKKDAARTVSEMSRLHQKYGHKLFFMTDSLLNPVIMDISREIIKRGLPVYMDGYFIVDDQTADIENSLLWRRGGFYRARLGCESGSQHVLDAIGKKITPAKIKAAVSSLAKAGVKTTTYWVIGHPGESEADFQKTLDLVEELKDDIWQAECNPFTYYYTGQANAGEWAKKRILLHPGKAWDMLITQTWVLECEPSREEVYDRVFRFVRHCNQLGIPNPYSADEIYKADMRWKVLHKNAVPSVIQLASNQNTPDWGRKEKTLITIPSKKIEAGDFCFS